MTLKKPAHQVVVTVLGAGTMGAGIAAHVAAAGCRVHLLDIVPKGVGGDAPAAARSAIALGALKALPKSKPPALMSDAVLGRIAAGNIEDDLARAVAESDLVIEAVVERLDVKVALFERVGRSAPAHAVLATNTSGISIDEIARGLPEELRARFLGLHFFNPPRWMHLLEVIPSASTAPVVLEEAKWFSDRVLGKGVVLARDTPNFIGNRIGIVEMLLTFRAATTENLTVEEVDYLNGPLLGRPKTGSFRLGDLVGLDVLGHVVENLRNGTSSDPSAPNYDPLHDSMQTPEVIQKLVASGRLGDKTGAGFYKKTKGEGGKSKVLSLDLQTLDYRDQAEPEFTELGQIAKLLSLPARVPVVLQRTDEAGRFLRAVLVPLFDYAASLLGQICEGPQEIDEAMRWGYGWELGPIELLDAAGPAWVLEEAKKLGLTPAPALEAIVAEGPDARFYGGSRTAPNVYVHGVGRRPLAQPEGAVVLARLDDSKLVHQNPTARLYDIGDGVACLEFRSKANILDDGVVKLIGEAPQILAEKGFRGLVLGNQADHFCRGANLMYIAGLIAQKNWVGVEAAVRALQEAFMGLRHGPIPVVGAPIGQALGGGTEALLHCDEVQAAADTFIGLVEVGVGLLPAGGGLKEIARRAAAWSSQGPDPDPYPWVRRGFECVAMGKVSNSALEAKQSGFLAASDGVTFHRLRVIADAKRRAIALAERGYEPPPVDEQIPVIGARGGANLLMGVKMMAFGGFASSYDEHIARKIVHVLSGGMGKPGGTKTAWQLLDLEREAFVSLASEEKTFQRIQHMLQTKRPLRN